MRRILAFGLVVLATSITSAQQAPLLNATERARAKEMLGQIKTAIRNDYYDKTFHGLDLNQHLSSCRPPPTCASGATPRSPARSRASVSR